MTSEPDIARNVALLENDRDALHELVDDFRSETHARLDQIDVRLDQHDARFDGHDTRFDRLDASLAEILRRLPEGP